MAEYHHPNTNNTTNLVLTLEQPMPPRATIETLRISDLGLATAAAASLLSRPAAMTTATVTTTTTTATSTPYPFDLPTSSYNTTNNDYNPLGARKKSTSFQITSVVSSHASNDGADDSADDMDDSHAEDGSDVGDNNSSKCAETPSASCSEDAYSRSEDGGATVAPPFIQVTPAHQNLPTNAQDSNSVLASDSQSRTMMTSAVSPSSALAPPPATSTPSSSSASSAGNPPDAAKSACSEADKDQQWQTRFKVVKIESQEPFRRGRWLCMDFLDHPSMQPSLSREESGSNNSSNASSVHYVPGENPIAEHPLGQVAEEPVSVSSPAGHPQQHQQMHATPVQSVPVSAVLPQATTLQPNFLPNAPTSTHYAPSGVPPGATYSQAMPLPSVAPPVVSFAVTNPSGAYGSTVYAPGSAPAPSYPASNVNPSVYPPTGGTGVPPAHYNPLPVSQPTQIGVYGSGVPAPQFVTPPVAVVAPVAQVLPPQNYAAPYAVATSFAVPPSSSAAFSAYPAAQGATAVYTATPIAQPGYQSVPSATPVSTYASQGAAAYSVPQQQQQQQPPPPQQAYVPPPSAAPTYAAAVTSTPAPAQFVVPPVAMATVPPVSASSVAETAAAKVVLPAAVSGAPATVPVLLPPSQTVMPVAVTSTSSTSASSILSSNTTLPPPTTSAAPLLPASAMGDEGIGGEESNSTAGSTVAIDNKIEQAMDLVKSHLMYAVREEVEVLKERIAELLDRISVLETENSILKASAPQEVLAELSSAVEDHHYNSQSSPAPPHQGPPSSANN